MTRKTEGPPPGNEPGGSVGWPRRLTNWRTLRYLGVVVVVCALIGLLGWWVRGSRSERAGSTDLGRLPRGVTRSDLNLVVITLDTIRADRIGTYGSRDVETPALDRLAKEGVLFEHAMSVAPLTLPAHSSIFTGRFPPEHGVRDNGGFFVTPEQLTLAEVMKQQGYSTGAFVAAFVLDSKWGLDQGFDTYFDDFDLSKVKAVSLGNIQRPGNEVVDRALPWMDQARTHSRFFAWIHLYDPHTPYSPPEPFRSKYRERPYNGEVAFTDTQVGRVIEFLESRGLLDQTVVAVMGDHGESLGDHGEGTHGFFIYESVTRVPFIVRAPFGLTQGRRVPDVVRAVDLMPTVLDLLGIAVPKVVSGTSLVSAMTGGSRRLGLEGYAEAMYPLHHYGWSDLRAFRAGKYKLIDAPRPELYDLEQDPGENVNLFAERRALGDRMLGRLRALEAGFEKVTTGQPAGDVDPEVRAKLAALGYVGSFVASAADPRTDRADPKDKIGLFNKLGAARDLSKERRAEEAEPFDKILALLNEVVREDPNVIDAWFMLGNQYFKQGDFTKAVEYYKRTLSLKPDYDIAVINLAAAYRGLGDDDAALAGFEHYLKIDPKDAWVRYRMGEIWLDRGDLRRAEERFNEAVQLDAQVAPAQNALGVIAFKRGDLDGAERLIRQALAIHADVRLAHYNLALVAEQRGDIRAAEREYVEELKLHPDAYKAAYNLSRLYEDVGDREGQIGALKQAIEGNPRFVEGHMFLAKVYLDSGQNLDEARRLAQKGLELEPTAEFAALGHYVLADIYSRQGKPQESARQAALGRASEARGRAGSN